MHDNIKSKELYTIDVSASVSASFQGLLDNPSFSMIQRPASRNDGYFELNDVISYSSNIKNDTMNAVQAYLGTEVYSALYVAHPWFLYKLLSQNTVHLSCRSESGNGWCLFSFLLIYYFAFAGILWFVMLSYAWHSSFRTLGSTKDKLAGKKTYFHVLAWMIPVIATITVLILEEVRRLPFLFSIRPG